MASLPLAIVTGPNHSPAAATAVAHPNIALVKYWGKRDAALNLPAVPSLSVTLDTLSTTTTVRFDPRLDADRLTLNGAPATVERTRVSATLDLLRRRAGVTWPAEVTSANDFPTAAGLASSASGFAALVVAADAALDLDLDRRTLSMLARRGSGSAARSLYGGYVQMNAGERADGSDSYAEPVAGVDALPLSVVIAITSTAAKTVGSTDGMTRTAGTSPYWSAWVDTTVADLDLARSAIEASDFDALARVAEHSCLKMHALAMSADPGLVYWNSATVACLHAVRALRESGVPVFFTIDAGPQVKALCAPASAGQVAGALGAVDGVRRVVVCGLGDGAHRVADRA